MIATYLNKRSLKRFNKKFKHNKQIYLVLDNLQYARNVASIFRIADAMNVYKIFLTGSTPKPPFGKQLVKVSRHKEKSVQWRYFKNTARAIDFLKRENTPIFTIEQVDKAVPYYSVNYPARFALLVGNEEHGVSKSVLRKSKNFVFIPMYGKGASLNVHVSLAIVGFYAIIPLSGH